MTAKNDFFRKNPKHPTENTAEKFFRNFNFRNFRMTASAHLLKKTPNDLSDHDLSKVCQFIILGAEVDLEINY